MPRVIFWKFICACLLVVLLAHGAHAQGNEQARYLFNTQVINVEDGLPDRFVYDMVQDHDGFIWMSTPEGISRYDGNRFKTIPNTRLGLAEGMPAKIVLDAQNRIWYSGRQRVNGVCFSGILDPKTDSVFSIQSLAPEILKAEQVQHVFSFPAYDSAVAILTYPSGILYRYNAAAWQELYRSANMAEPYAFCQKTAEGTYWLMLARQAVKIQPGAPPKVLEIPLQPTERLNIARHTLAGPALLTVNAYRSGRVVTLDSMAGVLPLAITGVPASELHDVLYEHPHFTCYRMDDELRVRNRKGSLLYTFRQVAEGSKEQTLNVRATLVDRQGNLWISTENGLLKLSIQPSPFTLLAQGNSIRGIYQDSSTTWLGGYQGKSVSGLPTAATQAFLQKKATVMSFFKDSEGTLWMGTDTRSYVLSYNPLLGQLTEHTLGYTHPLMLPFQNTQTGNYWIGTRAGVYLLDLAQGNVSKALLPEQGQLAEVRQFYQNQAGVWVVSSQGLFLIDAATEQVITHYNGTQAGLPFKNLNHMYEDPAQPETYWLGTRGGGLLRWDRATNNIRQFTRADGLSNNTIYAVYGDTLGNLWLPSDYGLMCFDKQAHTTRVYLPRNGIAHEEFNTFAHFQAADGTLYFGGLNGVTAFHPAEVLGVSAAEPPLYATAVRVLEQGAEELTDRTAGFEATGRVTLLPSDGMLELDLTFLDYTNTRQNQYAYQVAGRRPGNRDAGHQNAGHQNASHRNAGRQERWIYTNNPTLSILNLPYGTYTLTVKARGASGSWSKQHLTIPLHVLRPFYLQTWFIALAGALLVLAAVVVVRWRLKALEKDRQRLEREVHKRTKQLAEQAEQLKALDVAKTRFFSNITHEFRTPLTLVLGPVEQMLGWEPPTRIEKGLRRVQKNAQGLLRLINQLLDISKLEDQRMQVELVHGDLAVYTQELAEPFQALAQKQGIALQVAVQQGMAELHFDHDKWHKIVYNLLSNALKFTAAGGDVAVRLWQEVQQNQAFVVLQVADSGLGIAQDKLPHIFDRFYQANDSHTRTAEGTGIGLALVKEFVELLGGVISVTSKEGEGTTFMVKLPVQEEGQGIHPAPHTQPPAVAEALPDTDIEEVVTPEAQRATEGSSKLSLLLIEDNADMRDYVRSCLPADLYTITEAADGAEGIRLAQEQVPDLIISDVMMPKKDGFAVTHAVRSERATSHIPLILLTAKASLESRLEGLRRGADAYLTKPFSPAELALRIQKLIEIRQLLQSRYQPKALVATPNAEPNTYAQEDEFMGELRAFILEHLKDAALGPDQLTRAMGVSRTQLYRKIKTLTGHTLGELLRDIRCATAMQYIQQGGSTLSEVAQQTGFSSLSHFSRTFKKVYGIPPSEVEVAASS